MIKQYKPVTPGQRFRKSLSRDLDKGSEIRRLIHPLNGSAGKTNNGRITVRHKSRGAKKFYRVIDFKRDKLGVRGKVVSIEYDPNRGADIALISYLDGEKRYILAPLGLKKGMYVISDEMGEFSAGNSFPLKNIPLGTEIHNVEINPGQGAKIARGAGESTILVAKEGKYAHVKLPSGEIKKILLECRATIGILSNPELRNTSLGKAGRNRHLGVRPAVRGVAHASPRQHPHGGSYKDNGIGMPSPKTPWGKLARGVKTRKRRYTDKYVVAKRGCGRRR